MKWFKNEEINPKGVQKKIEEKNVAIRFTKKQQKGSEKITLFLSKTLLSAAEKQELNYLRFGYDAKKNQLMFQLNKAEQGLELLNKKGKYRNLLNGNKIVSLFEDNGIIIPYEEKMLLETKDKTTFFYNLNETSSDK